MKKVSLFLLLLVSSHTYGMESLNRASKLIAQEDKQSLQRAAKWLEEIYQDPARVLMGHEARLLRLGIGIYHPHAVPLPDAQSLKLLNEILNKNSGATDIQRATALFYIKELKLTLAYSF